MPGYRSLSSSVTGTAADSAREAESRRRDGDPHTAVRLLEQAIEASLIIRAEMPGWLCGRLAALYRTMCRYDDEVLLLERYRESQTNEDARSRFDARLSKARTIAERKRRTENGALASVTKVLGARRRRRAGPASLTTVVLPEADAHSALVARLRAVLADLDVAGAEERLATGLGDVASSARAAHIPADQLVFALQTAFPGVTRAGTTERDPRYSAALLRLLAVYFDETDR